MDQWIYSTFWNELKKKRKKRTESHFNSQEAFITRNHDNENDDVDDDGGDEDDGDCDKREKTSSLSFLRILGESENNQNW